MWLLLLYVVVCSAVELQRSQSNAATANPSRSYEPAAELVASLGAVKRSQNDILSRLDAALTEWTKASVARARGRVLGQRCRRDLDCTELVADSVCSARGKCRCAAGFQRTAGGLCRQQGRLGEECRTERDCRGARRAVCVDRRCSCPDGYRSRAGRCRPPKREPTDRSQEGQPCSGEQDCAAPLQNFTCTDGTCAVRMCDPVKVELYSTQVWWYRLSGGSSCDNGNVLATVNPASWHTNVCDYNWTSADATVVCRSLGFRSGAPKPGAKIGRSITSPVPNRGYACKGTEDSLMSCRTGFRERQECAANEFAAVTCYD